MGGFDGVGDVVGIGGDVAGIRGDVAGVGNDDGGAGSGVWWDGMGFGLAEGVW